MCLSAVVGDHCVNNRDDVKKVQVLLNLNIAQLLPMTTLQRDGRFNKVLKDAILLFQGRVMKMIKPDGRVAPLSPTLKALRAGIPSAMSQTKMQGIFLNSSEAVVTKFYTGLTMAMASISVNTPLRMTHFLSQIGHESGGLQYTEEIASGKAYEGRTALGNTQPGDGERFKGRGLIQLTGRANYQAYGKARGKDYTVSNNWTLIATDPVLAVDVAAYFWEMHDLNTLADHDLIDQITRIINGGMTGIADRRLRLTNAKCFLIP